MTRAGWDEYFLKVALLVSTRSTCVRRQHGAVIVKDKHILSTGYNGSVKGFPHCSDTSCIRQQLDIPSGERYELCNSVHAEANAIIQAAYHGVSIKDSTMYITGTPCFMCIKMIMNSGISSIVIIEDERLEQIFDAMSNSNMDYSTFKRESIL